MMEEIICQTRAEYDRLPQSRKDRARRIVVAGYVFKDRHGPVGGKA